MPRTEVRFYYASVGRKKIKKDDAALLSLRSTCIKVHFINNFIHAYFVKFQGVIPLAALP